jgi:hypothetical protein
MQNGRGGGGGGTAAAPLRLKYRRSNPVFALYLQLKVSWLLLSFYLSAAGNFCCFTTYVFPSRVFFFFFFFFSQGMCGCVDTLFTPP